MKFIRLLVGGCAAALATGCFNVDDIPTVREAEDGGDAGPHPDAAPPGETALDAGDPDARARDRDATITLPTHDPDPSSCSVAAGRVVAYSTADEIGELIVGDWLRCSGPGFPGVYAVGLRISADHRWNALERNAQGELVPIETGFDGYGTWTASEIATGNVQFNLLHVTGGGAGFFPAFTETGRLRLVPSDAEYVRIHAGGASDAGTDGDPPVGSPVWTGESQSLELRWFSFHAGGYRYKRQRSELHEEQVALLSAIRAVAAGPQACWADAIEMALDVTDQSGRVAHYLVTPENCGEQSELHASYLEAVAFADALPCRSAKSDQAASLAGAARIAAGDGCWHGIFNAQFSSYTEPPVWWFAVEVATPGRHRFELHDCFIREFRLTLSSADAQHTLASVEGAPEACPLVEYDIAQAGTYALKIELLGGSTAGDFYLSVDRAP